MTSIPRFIAATIGALALLLDRRLAAAWIWPLSGTSTPDAMNTSFGPRVDTARWDFHDGVDLPAPLGTPAYAVDNGTVYREGPGGTDGYSSRHVVLQVNHPTDGTLYALYLHIDTIAPGIAEGMPISKGDLLGSVGMDDATYTHLHFEVRRSSPLQAASVHPLHYLPYMDTANFTAPVVDRFVRNAGGMAARLLFGALDKNEGDLIEVEVDLMSGASLLSTRRVFLDDKSTVQEGNGDGFEYTGDIAVEGYQRSNMVGDARPDLQEGILVRNLPPSCDGLVTRVYDVGGHIATSALVPVPSWVAENLYLDFEDGLLPPPGWSSLTSVSGTGTSLANSPSAAHEGTHGLLATDASSTEGTSQTASVEIPLPSGRFEWTAEGWFDLASLGLAPAQSANLLQFQSAPSYSVAAVVRNNAGLLQPGILIRNPDNSVGSDFSSDAVASGAFRRWTLELLRLLTRETTAVLYLDGAEVARRNWDSTGYPPASFRAGLAQTSAGATATVAADEIRLSEGDCLPPPSVTAPAAVTITQTTCQ